jgi:ATP/maltotriose-dependent transcriptional regulator MalT
VLREDGDEDVDPVADAEQVLRNTRLDDAGLESIVFALLALIYADRLDKAAQWCDSILSQANASRAPAWQARITALAGEVALRRGNPVVAERLIRTALQLLPHRGWGITIGAPLATLGLALTATGDAAQAAELFSRPVPQQLFHTRYGLYYLNARGHHHLATNRAQAALDDFLACGEKMCTWGLDQPSMISWRTGAASAYLRSGKRKQARELAEEQLAMVGDDRCRTRGISLRVLAGATDARGRPRLLGRAIEALQAGGDRLELAYALADMSRAYRAIGEASRSRTIALHALRLADECQAEPLSRVLRRHNPTAMPEPTTQAPSPAADGETAVLSEAERRVAELVSRGHTNRQVAKTLFITVSTVEQHLTRVYRKLNITRRSDLAVSLQLNNLDTA